MTESELKQIPFFSNSDETILKKLVSCPIYTDFSFNDNFLIHSCIKNGHTKSVQFLLTKTNVSPVSEKFFSIFWRTISGFDDMLILFFSDPRIDFGIDENMLITAIEKLNDVSSFNILIKHPTVISTSIKYGQKFHLHDKKNTEECIKNHPEYFF